MDRTLLKDLHIDEPDTKIETQLSALRYSNGVVDVFRPYKDFLVVKPMAGPAEILGRCR